MSKSFSKQSDLGYEWFKSLPENERLFVAGQLIQECLYAETICWTDGDKDEGLPPCLYWEATGDPLNDPES